MDAMLDGSGPGPGPGAGAVTVAGDADVTRLTDAPRDEFPRPTVEKEIVHTPSAAGSLVADAGRAPLSWCPARTGRARRPEWPWAPSRTPRRTPPAALSPSSATADGAHRGREPEPWHRTTGSSPS
ncbi:MULTISPECIES: hypothetical protein [Streptomyces]|uniref:Uncharacterized protein n=1 Tax=Streptomyces doudnae TaxID=3075536 RepID=A0ABD5EXT2_9ACTN|nr:MULTISPECIES: hypothetical protein [unclassified Streptomyces]MDT0439465.1 hypothetical protein [Streptomyces sp. DSM 41981]MYQ69301.1 hypothetical protein [Streptomyces sp. SID4950]SCE52732.1 hypothetical protein GA0115242_146563 [Streptomyces sp. SolWspMP-5a-2]